MAAIHDSLLTGYVVDGTARTITLHTITNPGVGDADIDVIFRDVVAYHLEGDCFENVVFGIHEVSPEAVVGDGSVFAERFRKFGWPLGWNPNEETAAQFLSRPGVKVFQLSCSWGGGGWIAAASRHDQVVPPLL